MTCRMIELSPRPRRKTTGKGAEKSTVSWLVDKATGERPVPGDMFYYPTLLQKGRRHELSEEYWRDNARRKPLCVVLPTGTWFIIDSHYTGSTHGWKVTGEPPRISCAPSINVVGIWHGFLENGVLRSA